MTASPIEMPGRSVPVLSLPEALLPDAVSSLDWYERNELRERNEFAYRSTCAYLGLPESPHIAVEATESAVLVTATDMDVLAAWLHEMGEDAGRPVEKTVLAWGQTAWTLHTSTWSDSPRFPVVPVHITVVLPTDAPVMHEIAAAVTR